MAPNSSRSRLATASDAVKISVLFELAQPVRGIAVHQLLPVVAAWIDVGTPVVQHYHDHAQQLVRCRQDGARVGYVNLERVVVAVDLHALGEHSAVGGAKGIGPPVSGEPTAEQKREILSRAAVWWLGSCGRATRSCKSVRPRRDVPVPVSDPPHEPSAGILRQRVPCRARAVAV